MSNHNAPFSLVNKLDMTLYVTSADMSMWKRVSMTTVQHTAVWMLLKNHVMRGSKTLRSFSQFPPPACYDHIWVLHNCRGHGNKASDAVNTLSASYTTFTLTHLSVNVNISRWLCGDVAQHSAVTYKASARVLCEADENKASHSLFCLLFNQPE